MPLIPDRHPPLPTSRAIAEAVIRKTMVGEELSSDELEILLRLRAINLAQQLAATVRA